MIILRYRLNILYDFIRGRHYIRQTKAVRIPILFEIDYKGKIFTKAERIRGKFQQLIVLRYFDEATCKIKVTKLY